jgi:hypothetical protein
VVVAVVALAQPGPATAAPMSALPLRGATAQAGVGPAGAVQQAGAAPVGAVPARADQPAAGTIGKPAWRLRWAPDARRDGLAAFEHVEDDRGNSHPAAKPHISVEGDHYRFTMHTVDRDTSTDRQRQEVRGAVGLGHALNLLNGETWRFTYSMFIPDTLKSTTTFTHIMQMKAPGTGTNPMVTMSLRRYSGVQKIELKVTEGNVLVGATDLEPLQNHWVDVDFQMKIGDAPDGLIRWAIRDHGKTVIDTTTTGVDTWLLDRVRPKWGIYRSLGDASGSLQDTYMLVKDLRAYQWAASPLPPLTIRYEAERAAVHGGVVEATNGGYTGRGYVNVDDAAGAYVEWKVFALWPGRAAVNLWYANATTTVRPMDVSVNGATVAPGLAFERTPAWDDWETRTLIVPLKAGFNTIRATAATAAGGPNLDSVEVQPTFG